MNAPRARAPRARRRPRAAAPRPPRRDATAAARPRWLLAAGRRARSRCSSRWSCSCIALLAGAVAAALRRRGAAGRRRAARARSAASPAPASPARRSRAVREGSPYASPRARRPARTSRTSYGPPWGGIQGHGHRHQRRPARSTAAAPRWYMVAVDPVLIGHGQLVYLWPNPFGWRGPFLAADTGGAIHAAAGSTSTTGAAAPTNAPGDAAPPPSPSPPAAPAPPASSPPALADPAACPAARADGAGAAETLALPGVRGQRHGRAAGQRARHAGPARAAALPGGRGRDRRPRAHPHHRHQPLAAHQLRPRSPTTSLGLAGDFGSVANRFPLGGGFGTRLAAAALRAAGLPEREAFRLARAGGGHNVCHRGLAGAGHLAHRRPLRPRPHRPQPRLRLHRRADLPDLMPAHDPPPTAHSSRGRSRSTWRALVAAAAAGAALAGIGVRRDRRAARRTTRCRPRPRPRSSCSRTTRASRCGRWRWSRSAGPGVRGLRRARRRAGRRAAARPRRARRQRARPTPRAVALPAAPAARVARDRAARRRLAQRARSAPTAPASAGCSSPPPPSPALLAAGGDRRDLPGAAMTVDAPVAPVATRTTTRGRPAGAPLRASGRSAAGRWSLGFAFKHGRSRAGCNPHKGVPPPCGSVPPARVVERPDSAHHPRTSTRPVHEPPRRQPPCRPPTSTASCSPATSRATPSCAPPQSGTSVCSLRIASNTRRKTSDGEWVDKPNYFNVTVWGAQGENCARYLSKGRPVAIDGRLEWREWTARTTPSAKPSRSSPTPSSSSPPPDRHHRQRRRRAATPSPSRSPAGGADDADDIPF